MKRYQDIGILLLRVARAANFLSPVDSRFAWWEKESNRSSFVAYTGEVNSFVPTYVIAFLAVAATVLESILRFCCSWVSKPDWQLSVRLY